MKLKTISGLLAIAMLLLSSSIFFYFYSYNFISSDHDIQFQQLYDAVGSKKMLNISSDRIKEIYQLEKQAAEHNNKATDHFRYMFRYMALFLFVLGISQIFHLIYLYKRTKFTEPNNRLKLP